MTVSKMKLILVWICLISETFLMPTQSPDADDTTCCQQNPKLIYQGREANTGINIYVFQFLPKNKDAKDRVEDTTMKNDFQMERNVPRSSENYEDTLTPTNRPASIHANIQTPDKEAETRYNTHMPGLKVNKNDIEMYDNTGLVSNTTRGLQTGTSHIRDVQTTSGDDIPSNRNTPKTTENGAKYEDTINVVNTPASIYGTNDFPDTQNNTRDNSSTPDLNFDTITSTVSVPQNDIDIYEDRSLLASVTEGLQTAMSPTEEVRKTSDHSDGNDYYGTEGSTTLDIPGYNDTDMGNQGTNTDFLANINDSSINIGCIESDGQCKHDPKPKKDIIVTQPPTQKDLFYSKGSMDRPDKHKKEEKNTMNFKGKSSMKPTKTNKRKSEKQTKKILQYSSGKRQKSGGKRGNYRDSSSESRSDSSQEFD
ncbi:uncharacterized protein ACNLHF_011059 isoform 2-T2 [Anomaloglossus baeobatrachus]